MTAAEYRAARQLRGTQQGVAARLGIHWRALQKREAGDSPVSREAELAILSLPLRLREK